MRSAALAGALGGLVLLAVYPACPIHAYLHVLCPGCGATRASIALLHGDLATAWRMNALFVCALPLLVLYGARALRRRALTMPPALAWGGLGIAMVFGVARNF